MKQITTSFFPKIYWRHLLMIMIVLGSLALMFSLPPFGQNPNYHNFADQREFFGIPNFFDVASNLAFLVVGIAGLRISVKNYLGSMQNAWIVLFVGVALISAGSAYYHWKPNNQTLVWDRLPMTIGFIGLLIAILGEYISKHSGWLILPALLTGFFSVIYWHWFDDLRIYIWVQMISLLLIPIVMILYRGRFSHQGMILFALGLYALAKISEVMDVEIFALSQRFVSGHTIKHLLSAAGCLTIVLMLQRRRLLE